MLLKIVVTSGVCPDSPVQRARRAALEAIVGRT
jgi:hypothetical protein